MNQPDTTRPLVTFIQLGYNQEHCIGQAIAGALAQTYSPLEIILSDDCSSDRTFEIMQRAAAEYRGPHRIVLNRNPRNLYMAAHEEAAVKMAGGDLIVKADGDDISLPNRVEKLAQRWIELGCQTAILYSDYQTMDAAGHLVDAPGGIRTRVKDDIATMAGGEFNMIGCSIAFSRSVFEAFPAIQRRIGFDDRVLPFRALLLGGVASYVNEQLVQYCVEGGLSSTPNVKVHELAAKFLEDARQRLDDLDYMAPDALQLRKACLANIALHELRMALPFARGAGIERAARVALRKGVAARMVLKLYLKYRLPSIHGLYARRQRQPA